MDLTKTEITFNMSAGNVTFKATYLSVVKYEIYVVDGTKDKSPAKAGETVTINANPAKEGKVFDKRRVHLGYRSFGVCSVLSHNLFTSEAQ